MGPYMCEKSLCHACMNTLALSTPGRGERKTATKCTNCPSHPGRPPAYRALKEEDARRRER